VEYRQLGRTDLQVSVLCLGTMQWGWTATEKRAREVMDAFAEAGGNFIDTADVYSVWARNNPGGVSEEIIGRWMKDRGNRDRIIVATKVKGRMWKGADGEGLGRAHITQAVEHSLRRLQTDYIDLYQSHSFDEHVPIEETMDAFDVLVRAGKVRHVGASNYPAWRLALAVRGSDSRGQPRYESLQPNYSLVKRSEFERELRPLCETLELGVIPYSPLGAGFLTGKYRRGEGLPRSARATSVSNRYFDDERAWQTLDTVSTIASSRGATPAQVALAWLLAQPSITAPIVGANSVAQLSELLGSVEIELTRSELKRLEGASGGSFQWND
jgi:aryl-alcohol dehydrogenase-like predicted oxidoreductase